MEKNISAKSINEAIGTIIAKICYEAADELGLTFSEKISSWRKRNALTILETTNRQLSSDNLRASPRLVHYILEEGSWIDNELAQDMWAGLLASSCTSDGKDDSNLLFVNILKQLTSSEVAILDYSCKEAKKYLTTALWISAEELNVNDVDLIKLTGIEDVHRIDRELDHLRSLDLIVGGFEPESITAEITPTGLALQLYVRVNGSVESPAKYFDAKRQ